MLCRHECSFSTDISGPGVTPGRSDGAPALDQQLLDPAADVELREPLSLVRVGAVAEGVDDARGVARTARSAAPTGRRPRGDRPLVAERGEDDAEARVEVADAVRVGHAHVGEEDLVEPRGPGHLAQRAHLDPRRVHVDEERREALVLGHVGIGAAHREREVGDVRARRPHLLAVDDPLVAVAHRARRGRGEIGAGVRLAEELTHHDVAAVQLRQVRGAHLRASRARAARDR